MALSDTDGYNGRIVSLGGIQGRQGLGLQINTDLIDADPLTGPHLALVSNPGRVWALISNEGTLPIWLGIGINTPNGTFHSVQPGGNMLINKDFPWTGKVAVLAAATNAVRVTEASIQQ